MSYQLGVDLGTTYSAAAVRRAGRTEVVGLGLRSLEAPSVVFLKDDGEFLVGEAAERRGSAEPGRLAREFKRRIGDPAPILLAGSPHSPQSLTARLLRWVVAQVAEREGGPPDATVISYPANWGPFKQDLLTQAVRLADLHDVRTVTEPEAAAVQYASTTRVAPGEVVAVYDLGGGTFDAAVLRKTAEGFEVVGQPEGIEHLGGIDFDEAVTGYVVDALGEAVHGLDRSDPATLAAMARLRRDCVDAKEALSIDSEVAVPVNLPGLQTEVRLTRREFEAMIRPSLGDTIGALRRSLRSAELEPAALKAVVLVGGSGRIPLVAELVRTELGVPVAIDTHPKHGVAMGAALLAELAAGAGTAGGSAPAAAAGLVAWPPPPLAGTETAAPEATTQPAARPTPEPAATSSPAAEPAHLAPPDAPPPQRPTSPAAAPPAGPDEPRSKRPLVIGGVVVAVAAVVVAAVVALGGGGGDDEATAPTTTSVAPGISVPRSSTPYASDALLYTNRAGGETWTLKGVAVSGGGVIEALADPSGIDMAATWSPDRRTFLFNRKVGDRWELWVAAADGQRAERLVEVPLPGPVRAGWSPDGEQVAYVLDADGQRDVFLLDLTTGEQLQVTDDVAVEDDPAWSPDGTLLAVWRDEGAGAQIWLLDVEASLTAVRDGSGPYVGRQLTQEGGQDPDFNPEGTEVLFSADVAGVRNFYAAPTSGGGRRQITAEATGAVDASWSTDGSEVVFATNRDGDFDLYVIPAAGGEARQLTNEPGDDFLPAWT